MEDSNVKCKSKKNRMNIPEEKVIVEEKPVKKKKPIVKKVKNEKAKKTIQIPVSKIKA